MGRPGRPGRAGGSRGPHGSHGGRTRPCSAHTPPPRPWGQPPRVGEQNPGPRAARLLGLATAQDRPGFRGAPGPALRGEAGMDRPSGDKGLARPPSSRLPSDVAGCSVHSRCRSPGPAPSGRRRLPGPEPAAWGAQGPSRCPRGSWSPGSPVVQAGSARSRKRWVLILCKWVLW